MPKVMIAQHILAANETIAQELRQDLTIRGIHTINLMSSPGAGKTTLLEHTIKQLHEQLNIAVIEGDIETSADAERIEAAGAPTVQINTRGACHLEAHMLRDALASLNMANIQLLFVENIGNLVCPSAWDLGEELRVVVVSTSEGDDKPAKYPHMFATSQIMIINKLDLLPYIDYDLAKVRRQATAINPHLQIFEMSCRTGEGLDEWCKWLLTFARQRDLPSTTDLY
jgi:hydrogenase nickel incorporation protein HypB